MTHKQESSIFVTGSAKSEEVAFIRFPIGGVWLVFNSQIVDVDVSLLLLIDDMGK